MFTISWIYPALVIILWRSPVAETLQATVLDTTKKESLGWITYSAEEDVTGRRGWKEASYTNAEGDVFRIYTVCNIANAKVDNWLRTPYVPRAAANRLHVEVRFTMRRCSKYPDPERLQQCKESFKLLYYEAESDFANAMMPTWDAVTYRHVDVIAADRVFSDVGDAVINTETRSVPVAARGLYFAFQDQGACTTILSVRVYRVLCPSVAVNFAVFPSTETGLELTSIVQRDGTCVENSAVDQRPSYLCQADGNWYYPTGGCQCMPGYEPGQLRDECTACPPQTFKWSSSGERCLPCPAFSFARGRASVQCKCFDGYYRSADDSRTQPCTAPPSSVENLTVVFLDQSSVGLSWQPPLDSGGRSDLVYRVEECVRCEDGAGGGGGGIVVDPIKQFGLNRTNITLMGLSSQKQYTVRVIAENGVSAVSGTVQQKTITFRTSAPVPLKVRNVRVAGIGTDHVSLVWDDGQGFLVEMYEVRYWSMDGRHNASSAFSTSPNLTLSSLKQQTKFMIMVRCKTEKGWGEFSDAVYAITGHVFQYPTESPVAIIAGSIVAIFFCLVVGLVMMTVFIKRGQQSYEEKASTEDDDCSNSCNRSTPHLLDNVIVNGLTAHTAANMMASNLRTYIDPHTYEDPNEAVREFAKEIDLSCVIIESVLGGGEFGDVCKGILRIPGKAELSVAIKTLKPGASEKSGRDFLTEASIMGQFDDPNVIYMEGVVTKHTPIMILTEYMANGSLDKFLKSNDGKLTVLQLVGMMRGVASGMRYLSEMGFIHRDLAARNILVSETLICKVADFGLSREVETDCNSSATYTTTGGKIPIRWTAPEAISYRKFTSASDVWSYGVVMWEVMSFGEWPYWDWSNQDVIQAIEADYRLPPPMDCPDSVYQIMRDCWQKERGHRPKFSAIVRSLDRLIRTPELLRKIISQSQSCNTRVFGSVVAATTCHVTEGVTHTSPDDVTAFSSVDRWLVSIKMDRYRKSFADAGFRTLADVSRIEQSDLARLGITLAGHRKKFLSAICALQTAKQSLFAREAAFV